MLPISIRTLSDAEGHLIYSEALQMSRLGKHSTYQLDRACMRIRNHT